MYYNSILLAGDWAPGTLTGQVNGVGAEAMLCNLEAPLVCTKDGTPNRANKAGPHLSCAVPPLTGEETKIYVTLANNHIMDYGHEGFALTRKALEHHGIGYVGAGDDLSEACLPLLIHLKDVTVAVLSCCETQFGVADLAKPGVCPIPPNVDEKIATLKSRADHVIVSIHAASEMSPWPSPATQDLYRSWIRLGASVVHGHHSHVPQGVETYKNGLIIYGSGNLCVDPSRWSHRRNTLWSVGTRVSFSRTKLSHELITLQIRKLDTRLVVEPSADDPHHAYLSDACRPLSDRTLLGALWQETSIRQFESFYDSWLQLSKKPDKVQNSKRTNIPQLLRRKLSALRNRFRVRDKGEKASSSDHTELKQQMLVYHLFACKSHSEAITTALGLKTGEITDLRNDESSELAQRYFTL